MKTYKLQDIFVPAGFPEYTYVDREAINAKLLTAQINHSKHVLISGPSKSGKSNLWRKTYKNEDIIKIPINSEKNIDDIYCEILNALDAFYTCEATKEHALKASWGTEVKTMLAALFSAKATASGEIAYKDSEKKQNIARQVIAANLVIKYLKPTKKKIVLEDFHYSNQTLKNQLSQDLKAFSDEGCQFIMISVEYKNTVLLNYNQDLQQRIAHIQVGLFSEANLLEIISKGEPYLNISFSNEVKRQIVKESINSAAITQDICQRICIGKSLLETSPSLVYIDDLQQVELACKAIAEDQRMQYEQYVKYISAGGRNDGSSEKYKWFLKMIQKTDIDDNGILNTEVYKRLKDLGHKTITQTSVTTGLNYIPDLLKLRKLPPIMDYDKEKKTLFVLDKYMKFVLSWIPEDSVKPCSQKPSISESD